MLIGTIIAHKYATLHELQTIYTWEDAENMYEIIAISKYNENKAIYDASKKGRK